MVCPTSGSETSGSPNSHEVAAPTEENGNKGEDEPAEGKDCEKPVHEHLDGQASAKQRKAADGTAVPGSAASPAARTHDALLAAAASVQEQGHDADSNFKRVHDQKAVDDAAKLLEGARRAAAAPAATGAAS